MAYTKLISKTICWECARAVGFCSWSDHLEPVPGWIAEASRTVDGSFKVIECPEFLRDSITISMKDRNNGSGEISMSVENPPKLYDSLDESGCYSLIGAIGNQIVDEYNQITDWKIRMARLKELKRLGWHCVIARMQLEERRRWRRDYQQRCREMVTAWQMGKSGDNPAGGQNQGGE